jgi:hypothetical protein
MNCKPGDLALLTRAIEQFPEQEGRIFTVTTLDLRSPEPAWYYEGPVIRRVDGTHRKTWISLPDQWLRPIRDPGDDATDETLLWLPSPMKQTEAA